MPEPKNTNHGARRTRGRGFPVVALDEAVEILRQAGKYGHSHGEQAFAGYMGHQTTNSGAFKQRFAAMRSWGLITAERGQVALTDLGRRIAHPVTDDDAALAVREAFMHAEVFAELYSNSAKGQALETTKLANRAVQQLGVSPKTTRKFAQCFAASAVAAGLAVEVEPGKIELLVAGVEPRPRQDPGPQASVQGREGPPPVEKPVEPVHGERIVHQVWPVRGGAISFAVRLDRALPAQAFQQLADIFEAVEGLVGELGGMPADKAPGE